MQLLGILLLLPVVLTLPYTKVQILSYNDPLVDIADGKISFLEVNSGNDQGKENVPISDIPPAPVLPPLNKPVLILDVLEDKDKSTKNKTQKPDGNSEGIAENQDKIAPKVQKFGFLKPSKIISFLSGMPLPFPFSLITSVPSQLATVFSKPKYYVPYMVIVDDNK